MDAVVDWVDARERLPRDRDRWPVAAAISGRYPPDDPAAPGYPPDDPQESERDFWLVRPVYFATRHVADDGTEYRGCFVDPDGVVRLPCGRPGAEPVTHWAALPALPGMTVHCVLGEEARAALRNALACGAPGRRGAPGSGKLTLFAGLTYCLAAGLRLRASFLPPLTAVAAVLGLFRRMAASGTDCLP